MSARPDDHSVANHPTYSVSNGERGPVRRLDERIRYPGYRQAALEAERRRYADQARVTAKSLEEQLAAQSDDQPMSPTERASELTRH